MRDNDGLAIAVSREDRSGTGPLIRLRARVSRSLWRIGPAWSVLAGAIAAGASPLSGEVWLRLGAAILLADPGWGILRRAIPAGRDGDAGDLVLLPSLPYAQPDAPLARFLAGLAAGHGQEGHQDRRVAWQELAIGLAFTIALSILLGGRALAVSAAAVGVVLLARSLVLRGSRPAFCLALLDVALPWVLGMLAGAGGHFPAEIGPWLPAVAVAAALTVQHWGQARYLLSDGWRSGGIWWGQAALIAVLVGLRRPEAAAVATILLLPTSWYVSLRRCGGAAADAGALAPMLPWWWSVMAVSAFAVR